MRQSVKQFARFAVVGTSTFFIDYALLMVLSQLLGMNPVLAGAISFTVSLVLNYLLSMRFVFTRRQDISRIDSAASMPLIPGSSISRNKSQLCICQQVRPIDFEFSSTLTTGYGTLFSGMRQRAADGRPSRCRDVAPPYVAGQT